MNLKPIGRLCVLGAWWAAGLLPAGAAELVIQPGEVVEFTATLNDELRYLAGGDRPSAITGTLAAVAVPADFSPDRDWPVLLVSATSDPGHNSSRRLLHRFAGPALKAGWIVVAADPDAPVRMTDDNDQLRYALLMGALMRLYEEWPGIGRWPRAFGGFSGGAKRSAMLAGFSTYLGYPTIGVYQAGCNAPSMRYALEPLKGELRTRFLATPVFLSSGRDDPIATARDMAGVRDDLKHHGFTSVRFARFQGTHEVYGPHIEEALRWFAEQARKPADR